MPPETTARTSPQRLDRIDEIDAGWISSVLDHAGVDASVSGVALEPFGDGKVSDTARVRITYDRRGTDAPDAVVCKFHSSQPGAHEFAIGARLYANELHSYREIGARGTCRMPRAFLSVGDHDWINLVMDDLSGTTTAGDTLGGCDVAGARALVRELADRHAPWLDPAPPTAPGWALPMADTAAIWNAPAALGATLSAEWFTDRLPASSVRLLGRLPEATDAFFAHRLDRVALTHGDTKADNLLFEHEGDDVRAVLLDWQNVGLRDPMFDVAYFLAGSMTVEDRRTHERDLLELYAERSGGRSATSGADAAVDAYRVQLLSGVLQTTTGVAFISAGGTQEIAPAAQDFLVALLDRNLAAIDDWDSIGGLAL